MLSIEIRKIVVQPLGFEDYLGSAMDGAVYCDIHGELAQVVFFLTLLIPIGAQMDTCTVFLQASEALKANGEIFFGEFCCGEVSFLEEAQCFKAEMEMAGQVLLTQDREEVAIKDIRLVATGTGGGTHE